MRRFALRPEPHVDESFNGFLLRVGRLNCVFKPAEILQCLGIEPSVASGNFGWLEAPSREIFRALERRLERPLESHRVRLKERDQLSWLRSSHRMISDLRLGFPRICPGCLSEQGFLDWRWGLAVTAHCPKHECLLVARYPCCGEPLAWGGSLLIGCPNCEKSWNDMEFSRPSEVTETERQLWKEMDTEFSEVDASLLRDICLAIVVSTRPFDVIHEAVKVCPRLNDHSAFVGRAYQLLESPSMNAAWRKQCHEKRNGVRFLGQDFVEAPCDVFSAQVERHWKGPHEQTRLITETSTPEQILPEVTEYISQSRRDRKLEFKGSSGYRYHVTVLTFAEITGMSMKSTHDFFRGKALIAHKNVRYSNNRRFDLRQFRQIIRALPNPENSIEIFPDNKAFKKHLTTFGQLANDLILRKVPGGFSETSGIRSVFLDRHEFEKWLTARLFRNAKRELKLEQVTEALDCTTQDVHALVKAETLKWAKSQNGRPRVRGRSFCQHVMLSDQV